MSDATAYQRPAEILQQLIRFDTTNPPGHEYACIQHVAGLLAAVGIESEQYALDPQRPNLVARVPGRGEAPPLLLYGHVDVVTTEGQDWAQDPFGGELIDGMIWGRGALDMKGAVAMMISAVMRLRAEGVAPPGDVILCVLADEEDAGNFGAKYMVEQHAALFEGVRYAFGEFGGFNLPMAGKTFYPIQVSEKQICWLRATLKGPGGHGSMVHQGGTMARLGEMLTALDNTLLPLHITPPARMMFDGIADNLGFPMGGLLRLLTSGGVPNGVLSLAGSLANTFSALMRNTVNATIVHGGEKVNVIPSEIEVDMDGRMVPGFTPEAFLAEVQAVVGPGVALEVVQFDPGPAEIDMGLFGTLGGVLQEMDPAGTPIPLLLSGVTDGRFFTRLGIQTYGFTPMQLPVGMDFASTIHAADERVPAAAIEFGSEAIFRALQRFHD